MYDEQICPTCGRPLPLDQGQRIAKWVLRQLARNGSLTWSQLSRRVASRDRGILRPVVDDLVARRVVTRVGCYELAITGTPAAMASAS